MLDMSNETPSLKELLEAKNMRLAQLATALKVNKSLVTRWNQNRVPIERLADVERVTGISRQVLRPDVFGGVQIVREA